MIELIDGATRFVVLTRKRAYKVPRFTSWRLFLNGLLANMQEAEWSGFDDRLCPVQFSLPGGFLTVMRKAEPVTIDQWSSVDIERYMSHDSAVLPVEHKISSFGWLDSRLVAVDYGS